MALLSLIWLAGCDSYRYHSGKYFEETKRYFGAVKAYEAFAASRPRDPRAAEVLVRAADIYSTRLKRCLEARRLYETALRAFPDAKPWAERAEAGMMGCPDYFPLEAGRTWTYGDTASRGKYMRLEWEVRVSSGSSGRIASVLYAGDKRTNVRTETYEKRDWAVWERIGQSLVPILKYPFTPGTTWKTMREKSEVVYEVETADARVEVAAGTFEGCLKVREFDKRFPGSWKYDYYAPGVGRVKTTVGGPGFENPNTELIKSGRLPRP